MMFEEYKDIYVVLTPEEIGASSICIPMRNDFGCLTIQPTFWKCNELIDGRWVCGCHLTDRDLSDLMEITGEDTPSKALRNLASLQLDSFYIGLQSDPADVTNRFTQLQGTITAVIDGETVEMPKFNRWGGTAK